MILEIKKNIESKNNTLIFNMRMAGYTHRFICQERGVNFIRPFAHLL